jgi:hypothetical protein
VELNFFLLQIAFFLHFLFRHFTFPDLFLSKFIDSRYLFLHLFFCRDFVCLDSNSNSERLYYISCIFSISLLIYYLIITFLFWFWWKNEDKTWTNPYWSIQHQDSTNENFRSLRFSVWISANYYYPINLGDARMIFQLSVPILMPLRAFGLGWIGIYKEIIQILNNIWKY